MKYKFNIFKIFKYCIHLILCSLGYHKYTSWVTLHEHQGASLAALKLNGLIHIQYNGFKKVPALKIINEECIYCKKRHFYTPLMGAKYNGEPPKIINFFHL
jgi:hypothetical protein